MRGRNAPASGPVKPVEVEYRVVWNKSENVWNVFRNGAATQIAARKKKTSAVASAIREAVTEQDTMDGVAVVSVEGRKIETVWRPA
jgi:hypothetical protein